MIEFKNVKLNLKNIDILNDLSFKIEDKSITCFVGNKNSGKSSILKLLARIYKEYSGEILINGVDLFNQDKVKIDMVHDTIEHDPNLTVVEYLEFYGSIYGTYEKKELSMYIDKMLKYFSLMSYKYTSLENLDKENYKLLDIIRVMINNPDVLLFDNLFFSDNIDFNEKLLRYIKTFAYHKTIIFVARNLKYIEEICDNIGILDYGTLIAFGKKEDVYKKAELISKIEVKVNDDVLEAVELLRANEDTINISYENDTITFSINPKLVASHSVDIKGIEADILKSLIDKGVKVSSYRKQQVQFEQLFGRLI